MNINIRPYRHPQDQEELRRIFLLATNTGPGSPIVERDAQISRYTTVARLTFSAALTAFAIPLANPLLQLTDLHLFILHSTAGFFATVFAGLVWYIRDLHRRSERLFDTFRGDALKGDFQDVIGRWGLIVQDGGARCVPDGPNGFWVAEKEEGGEVVGCIGLKKHPHDHKVGEVGRLVVSPDHQRKGVGDKLMVVVVAHARANGIKRLELVTSYFNKAAVGMYTRNGWERCGEFKYGGFGLPVLGKDLDEDTRVLPH